MRILGIILLIVLVNLIMDSPQGQKAKKKLYNSEFYKQTVDRVSELTQ